MASRLIQFGISGSLNHPCFSQFAAKLHLRPDILKLVNHYSLATLSEVCGVAITAQIQKQAERDHSAEELDDVRSENVYHVHEFANGVAKHLLHTGFRGGFVSIQRVVRAIAVFAIASR